MHPLSRRFAFVFFVLSAAVLACTLPVPPGDPTPSGDLVSTAVAQTLQAATDAAPAETAVEPTALIETPMETQTETVEAATRTPVPPLTPAAPSAVYIDSTRNLWLWVEGSGVVSCLGGLGGAGGGIDRFASHADRTGRSGGADGVAKGGTAV